MKAFLRAFCGCTLVNLVLSTVAGGTFDAFFLPLSLLWVIPDSPLKALLLLLLLLHTRPQPLPLMAVRQSDERRLFSPSEPTWRDSAVTEEALVRLGCVLSTTSQEKCVLHIVWPREGAAAAFSVDILKKQKNLASLDPHCHFYLRRSRQVIER